MVAKTIELGTDALDDEVVNQRLMATVYMTQDGERAGRWGIYVWMDRDTDQTIPFEMPPESQRGWGGAGLTEDERRYVAAIFLTAATEIAGE